MSLKKLALYVFSSAVVTSCGVTKEQKNDARKNIMEVIMDPMDSHKDYPETLNLLAGHFQDLLAITHCVQLGRATYWDLAENNEQMTEKERKKKTRDLLKIVKAQASKVIHYRKVDERGYLEPECDETSIEISQKGIQLICN